MLTEVANAKHENRRHIKPALEAKRCSSCLMAEDDLPEGRKLLACAKCRVVNYCSKECQKYDWKQGGHKERCVAVGSSSN